MEYFPNLKNTELILASKSPRRQHLLKELHLPFTIKTLSVDEVYPPHLKREQIPLYLARLKADAFSKTLNKNQLVITADTIVWINNGVLEKPTSRGEAISMLNTLSGDMHTVYTGVCLKTTVKEKTFWASTDVYFRALEQSEIEYYIDKYQPYDKAGSYGIQEWIGYIGIEQIKGSYFNVMGLPIQKLYDELKKF